MAGLIDVGILKPELAGSFAAGYRGAEEQRNALAQRQQQAAQAEQQLASGRQRLQMDEMTMQRMQEDRAALTGLRARLRAAGQSDDPKVFFRVLAESDDPNVMMKGIEGLQRYRALEAYDREFGSGGAGATAMPSSAPNAMVAPAELAAGAQPEPMAPVPGVISTSRVPGVTTAPITSPTGTMREIAPGGAMGAEMPFAPANTLAPPAAAPVNAMLAAQPAAPASDVNALRRQYSMAVAAGRSDAPVLLKQIEAALRGEQVRAPKITVLGVAKGTETPVYFDEYANQQFTIGAGPSGQQVRVPYMGGVNRSTSTVTATATSAGTPVAKSLAGPVGARAETSLAKAEGASGIMESANMVRDALNTGNVIAGPLAGVRTKFAQVLELAGAGDKEKLVNTRNAIQGLATLTLESRAELKGQGQVTENEQKLLERARSGNIEDMTIAELQSIVNVSQRLAGRLWSSHQNLLKTMETDPAAADSLRYYRPTVSLPQAVSEGRPKAETDKRQQGLANIFGGKK